MMTTPIRTACGEPGRTAADLDWDLKRPCADCPFRRSTPFHAGVCSSALNYLRSIEAHNFSHTCHKTDPASDSEQGQAYGGRLKHCVGSLFMLLKTGDGFDLQMPLLQAAEDGKLDIHELARAAEADEECYTLSEFLAACGAGLERFAFRLRNRRRGMRPGCRKARRGV
jgi:hypothetical protein